MQKAFWASSVIVALFVMPAVASVSIADCGAVEGGANCSAAISAAIRRCAKSGGGQVVVPEGRWLTGAIRLESNVELRISENAVLEFTDDPSAYLPAVRTAWEGIECLNYSPLVSAYGATNVAITGRGVLTARTGRWASWCKWGGRAGGCAKAVDCVGCGGYAD